MEPEDPNRLAMTEKILESMEPKDFNEYYVEGSVVDMPAGPVHCQLDALDGDRAAVILAEGPYTGAKHTISVNDLKYVDTREIQTKSEDLFK